MSKADVDEDVTVSDRARRDQFTDALDKAGRPGGSMQLLVGPSRHHPNAARSAQPLLVSLWQVLN